MSWTYTQPVEIVFQTGGIQKLGDLLQKRGYQKGVLICDPYFARNGLAEKVCEYAQGKLLAVYHEITPNPRVQEVDACAQLLRETQADFAVALGGGSAMDCAKAACAVATAEFSARDYHSGGKPLSAKTLPLVAVPTTAGTGSEVTSVAVLTDPELGRKAPLGSPVLYPKLALIDPSLTCSVPPMVTASCGLDVLAHALEAFWSKGHQPVCDALALHAASLVFEWLPVAVKDGKNMQAREKMCEASVIAGLSFALPKTAASHAISFPLTNVWGIPHGEACAFTLGALCHINREAEGGRLDCFAQKLGFSDAAEMGDQVDRMKREFGLRCTLQEAGIWENQIDHLARLSEHPNLHNNPVSLSHEQLVALFKSLQES